MRFQKDPDTCGRGLTSSFLSFDVFRLLDKFDHQKEVWLEQEALQCNF